MEESREYVVLEEDDFDKIRTNFRQVFADMDDISVSSGMGGQAVIIKAKSKDYKNFYNAIESNITNFFAESIVEVSINSEPKHLHLVIWFKGQIPKEQFDVLTNVSALGNYFSKSSLPEMQPSVYHETTRNNQFDQFGSPQHGSLFGIAQQTEKEAHMDLYTAIDSRVEKSRSLDVTGVRSTPNLRPIHVSQRDMGAGSDDNEYTLSPEKASYLKIRLISLLEENFRSALPIIGEFISSVDAREITAIFMLVELHDQFISELSSGFGYDSNKSMLHYWLISLNQYQAAFNEKLENHLSEQILKKSANMSHLGRLDEIVNKHDDRIRDQIVKLQHLQRAKDPKFCYALDIKNKFIREYLSVLCHSQLSRLVTSSPKDKQAHTLLSRHESRTSQEPTIISGENSLKHNTNQPVINRQSSHRVSSQSQSESSSSLSLFSQRSNTSAPSTELHSSKGFEDKKNAQQIRRKMRLKRFDTSDSENQSDTNQTSGKQNRK